jgi:hypothetical protein
LHGHLSQADQRIIIDPGADERSAREAVAVLGESLPAQSTAMLADIAFILSATHEPRPH